MGYYYHTNNQASISQEDVVPGHLLRRLTGCPPGEEDDKQYTIEDVRKILPQVDIRAKEGENFCDVYNAG